MAIHIVLCFLAEVSVRSKRALQATMNHKSFVDPVTKVLTKLKHEYAKLEPHRHLTDLATLGICA
jgi:hypothetical protein